MARWIIALGCALAAGIAIGYLLPRKAPSAQPIRPTNVLADREQVGADSPVTLFDWRVVESADYRRYIANLRAIGCPEETIRDIIEADVDELFRQRLATLPLPKYEFWRPIPALTQAADAPAMRQRRTLEAERNALVKQLLGAEPKRPFGSINRLDLVLDFLPTIKRARIAEIETAYDLRLGRVGIGSEAARALQIEKDKLVAEVLTPEEKVEYDLRLSPTAESLRRELSGFAATEDEFRNLHALREQFEEIERTLEVSPTNAVGIQQRRAALADLEEMIKQVLGRERYIVYKQEQEWPKSSLVTVARELSLPKERAIEVLHHKQIAQERAENIRGDPNLSMAAKLAALRQVKKEATDAVTQIIGEEGLRSYQVKGSRWLIELESVQDARTR